MSEEHQPQPSQNDAPPEGYSDAARVASLAEAGYLVSVLEAEGLDAVVRHTRSFSAVNGSWLSDYVVQAPTSQLSEVAAVLRSEAAQMNEEPLDDEEDEAEFRQVVWRPVALMAVAGVVSFIAGQQLASPLPSGAPRDLADAVGRVGRPFFTLPNANGVRHRLFYEEVSDDWLLDTDSDGDGQYDRRSRFTAERPAQPAFE